MPGEAGRRRPRLSSVARLATALGLDPAGREQLIAAVGSSSSPSAVTSAAETAATQPANLSRGGSRCQLPADTRLFTGRTRELDRLLALAREAPGGSDAGMVVISAIDGMGGVGKSALAVHAAHRMRGHFPDGQLFIDLHGHTAGLAPLAAADALDWFLRSLGVPPQLIPQDLGERAAFYRDRLADTRTLIVLDNAVSTAQIRPLLPGTPTAWSSSPAASALPAWTTLTLSPWRPSPRPKRLRCCTRSPGLIVCQKATLRSAN